MRTFCECPDESVEHGPGMCRNTAECTVLRSGIKLVVCGDCKLSRDVDAGPVNA